MSNGNIFFKNIFENIWIQPAAGDSGGALGAAYALYYQQFNNKRIISKTDKMQGSYLGPKFCRSEIKLYLESVGAIYEYVPDENKLVDIISNELSKEKIIGWHFDRMEFGPRALGHRSILGDARSDKIQSTINLKIKFRESFRPFAPSVLSEKVGEWFDLDRNSPYMLLVAPVKKTRQVIAAYQDNSAGIEKLKVIRSEIPAVTHVDYTARVQTVHVDTNTRYHKLISKFEEKTKCPVIVNTSFNIRGEPIVCSPEDSYKCFTKTNMDILVIDDFILYKKNQNRNHL